MKDIKMSVSKLFRLREPLPFRFQKSPFTCYERQEGCRYAGAAPSQLKAIVNVETSR